MQPIAINSLNNLKNEAESDANYNEPRTTTARLYQGSNLFSSGVGQSASKTNLNNEMVGKHDDSTNLGFNVIKEEGKRKSVKKAIKDK